MTMTEIQSISKNIDKMDSNTIIHKGVSSTMSTNCPYLGTVMRDSLDFDFKPVCSVSLSETNVYACLVCGSYLRGRGIGSPAHDHAMHSSHHLFIKFENGRIYCVPDDYEVLDSSFADIFHNLRPTYQSTDFLKEHSASHSLKGLPFWPGCVGMNNVRNGIGYLIAVVQIFNAIPSLRTIMLIAEPMGIISQRENELGNTGKRLKAHDYSDSVNRSLRELTKRCFNNKNYKGVVCPQEFLNVVSKASDKYFFINSRAPAEFLIWLLNQLKPRAEINAIFQGTLKPSYIGLNRKPQTKPRTFRILPLTLPDEPLFSISSASSALMGASSRNQVDIYSLIQELMDEQGMLIHDLPPVLIFNCSRTRKTTFGYETNHTFIRFPLIGLDMRPWAHPSVSETTKHTKYDLTAVAKGGGPVGRKSSNMAAAGDHDERDSQFPSCSCYVLHYSGVWFYSEDLEVRKVIPQSVALVPGDVFVYLREDVDRISGEYVRDNIDVNMREQGFAAPEDYISEEYFGATDKELRSVGIEIG